MPERIVVPPRRRRWEEEPALAPESAPAPQAEAEERQPGAAAPPAAITVRWERGRFLPRPTLVLPWQPVQYPLELYVLPLLAMLCAAGLALCAASLVARGVGVPFGGWLWGFAPLAAAEVVAFTLASVWLEWPLAWRVREALILAALTLCGAAFQVSGGGAGDASFGLSVLAALLAPGLGVAVVWGTGVLLGLTCAHLPPPLRPEDASPQDAAPKGRPPAPDPAAPLAEWCRTGEKQMLALIAGLAGFLLVGGQVWPDRPVSFGHALGANVAGGVALAAALAWMAALQALQRRARFQAATGLEPHLLWFGFRTGTGLAAAATLLGLLLPGNLSPLSRFNYFDFFTHATERVGWLFVRQGAIVQIPTFRLPVIDAWGPVGAWTARLLLVGLALLALWVAVSLVVLLFTPSRTERVFGTRTGAGFRAFWRWALSLFRTLAQRVSEAGARLARPEPGTERARSRTIRLEDGEEALPLSPAARVRLLFLRLLQVGARLGRPRTGAQTAAEYAADWARAVPDGEQELTALARAFERARYSLQPVDDQTAQAALSAWRRAVRGMRRCGREQR